MKITNNTQTNCIQNLCTKCSCIYQSDKITVYDGKNPEKSSIMDVLCSDLTKISKKYRAFKSTGPNMLIEFDVGTMKNSLGFYAKYRFIEVHTNSAGGVGVGGANHVSGKLEYSFEI